jgi:hypothetical protein
VQYNRRIGLVAPLIPLWQNNNTITWQWFGAQKHNCREFPPTLEYSELLALQTDDIFWNEGLFTNANEPWPVDPLTQEGICCLAYFKHSIEEKRRS